jgi:hypothetical protein
MPAMRVAIAVYLLGLLATSAGDEDFTPLFPRDGSPKGWRVTAWNDLSKPGPKDAGWSVKAGILQTGKQRGSWLVSDKEYSDFILEFEIKLDKLGNSGVALRAPLKGDPAFEAMEMQVADLRYNTKAREDELTGAIYRSLAPSKQVYKPTEWNRCRIELRGPKLKITLNGEPIQDTDLSKHTKTAKRHDGSDASALKDRPTKGHIGFQHLSRDNSPVLIRNARIKELK